MNKFESFIPIVMKSIMIVLLGYKFSKLFKEQNYDFPKTFKFTLSLNSYGCFFGSKNLMLLTIKNK